jgi:hypothetical protein
MESKYKVGDKVVAVTGNDGKYTKRVIGKVYTVTMVAGCMSCNTEYLCLSDIQLPKSYNLTCASCKESSFRSNRMWHRSIHFTSADNLEEQLRIALEQENYELAATLRDKMKQV